MLAEKKNQTRRQLEAVEDYCQWGISLEGASSKAGISASGFLRKMHTISRKLAKVSLPKILDLHPSEVTCLDIVHGKCNKKKVYYWHGKCPYTKTLSGWYLSATRSKAIATRLVNSIFRNLGYDPKIWVSDGEQSFHTALKKKYKKKLRTVYLCRKPADWHMKPGVVNNSFVIEGKGDYIIVKRNLQKMESILKYRDESGYERITSIVLNLFNNHKARIVCINYKYRISPFKNFYKRFVHETEDDGYIYHFIGSCDSGNSWAESTGRKIKRRNKWFDNNLRSLRSGKLTFHLRMIVENLMIAHTESNIPMSELWRRIQI